jgi:hypothetical protein
LRKLREAQKRLKRGSKTKEGAKQRVNVLEGKRAARDRVEARM